MGFLLVMGWVEAIVMPEVRVGKRCWVSVAGVEEDIVVVGAGDAYVVGAALDDWYMVPVEAVRRFLAAVLGNRWPTRCGSWLRSAMSGCGMSM
jgi:hypothetical protein